MHLVNTTTLVLGNSIHTHAEILSRYVRVAEKVLGIIIYTYTEKLHVRQMADLVCGKFMTP